ncbi:ATP-grasp fold amidoligase family protein [Flavobacterium luminosum]|uniref:Glycosyltransferase n=1 Tax=Flavobacterium luminosum TaxID=2949086 RepID=A0ABT0TLV8_9FLAO|nr:ATP-grasp fold amidoligase family protein [Flavobacterium sp. HXWNR70]MCL9808473.1 glycosyltransferase [Flavobacterium sp. HXWNR70]
MEKIQWLKLYYYKEKFGNLVDKYEVRNFVESKIGASYLNPIIGVFNSVEVIDFKSLPKQFVIKGTHGSGYNIIVKDKNSINEKGIKKELYQFLNENYFFRNREYIYKEVPPRLIVENYISELDSDELIDYKFYTFHGVPKYVLVKKNENGKSKKCFYDLNWTKIYPDSISQDFLEEEIAKPENLDEMITVARKLASDFIFVRVDLYYVSSKIIFGELTFFPTAGMKRFKIEHFNKELGEAIILPAIA